MAFQWSEAPEVNVKAGVLYDEFQIHAASGLGNTNQQNSIRVKLVPYDMRSTSGGLRALSRLSCL